jgi:hypothetical protein
MGGGDQTAKEMIGQGGFFKGENGWHFPSKNEL